ncbi:hypothetical protein YPPY05_2702, partial [Yersinia pestis PY-05]
MTSLSLVTLAADTGS